MPIEYKRRPTFFEIFQARCSTADLGPISLNWFEELSSEAPPYNFEPSEEYDYKAHNYEPHLFKTPQRKPPYHQLASTPIIFKEQGQTQALDQSPFNELGKITANSKHKNHRRTKAKVGPMLDVASPPLRSCLSESPLPLRRTQVVPQREKPVLYGSLFSSPKIEEGQTPKPISESLGVEVDPDMSWSSSLATPPTLSSTVLIARDEEARGIVYPEDSPAQILRSYFSNHNESLKKNDRSLPSVTDSENRSQRQAFSHGLEKMLGDSSGKTNSFKDCLQKTMPSVVEDWETTAETSEEDSFSLCFPKRRSKNLQKMRMGKSRKKIFSDVRTDELSEEASRWAGEKHSSELDIKPSHSDPLDPDVTNQKPCSSGNEEICKEAVQSSSSGWSQLTLSGLTRTQMGKTPPLCISSNNQNNSEKDFIDTKKEGIDSIASEKSLPHISVLPEPEKVISEKTLGDRAHEGQHLDSHEVSIAGEQAVFGTCEAACLFQSVGKSVFRMREPLEECLGTVFSESETSLAATEEPGASASVLGTCAMCSQTEETGASASVLGTCAVCSQTEETGASASVLGTCAVCSQTENSFCPGSADSGTWPTTLTHTSATGKTAGLISSLKNKRKKFIYSVSDDASHQRAEILAVRTSELTNPSAQSEASAFDAPFMFTYENSGLSDSSVIRSSLQNDPEEPSLSLANSFVTASNKESSHTNALISQDLNVKEAVVSEEKSGPHTALETDCLSCLPEKQCENEDQKSPKVSNGKKRVLVSACCPAGQHAAAVQPSSTSFELQEDPIGGHKSTSIFKVTPSSTMPLSKPVVVSGGKVCKMPEKLQCQCCKDNTELSKNIPLEKNKICVLSESSKTSEFLPPGKYVTEASPAGKSRFSKNTNLAVIRKDQEKNAFISEISVNMSSEELFPENENNIAFQVTYESNKIVLGSTVELQEEDLSHAKGPDLQTSPAAAAVDEDKGDEQAARALITNDSDSSACTKKSRSTIEQHLKGTADKDLKLNSSLDVRSAGNNDYTDPCSWFLDPVFSHNFGGSFRTASNKEIKLSEHNVKKSKIFFKDIEDQYPTSLACIDIVNALPLANQKRLSEPYTFDLQSVTTVSAPSQSQASASCEDTHTSPQVLSSKQDFHSNHSLTPSQKAEITELSTILEESGSQFEFTQFRKPSRVAQNNVPDVPGNLMVAMGTTSEEREDVDPHLTMESSSVGHTDHSKKFEGSVGVKQNSSCLLKGNCNESTSCFLTNVNEMEFEGFRSALGTKLSVSNEALQKAVKLFSDIENISEETSANIDPRAFSSSADHDSVASVFKIKKQNSDKSFDEKTSKCQVTLQNNAEMTTGGFVGKNPENCTRNTKYEDNYTGSQRSTYKLENSESSKPSTGVTVDVPKDGGDLPCAADQSNKYPETCTQYVREENTQIKECISDLTCLEVMKAEETCCIQSSDKEQLPSGKMEQNIKDFNISFQTASGKNIRVSEESLSKSANILNQETDELIVFSDPLSSIFHCGINKNKMDISCHKETTSIKKVFKERFPLGTVGQLPTLQQHHECEIESTKEPTLLSFHTASGKKVKITQDSLDKVKNLFDETQYVRKTTSFSHQESKSLKDKENFKEGLTLACETIVEIPASKSEEMQENSFGSKETGVPPKQSDHLYRQTENLRTSNSTSSNEIEKSPTTSCIRQLSSSVTEDCALACDTGHGRKTCVTEFSLPKGRKQLREGLGNKSERKNAAEIDCVKEYTEGYTGNASDEHSSDSIRNEASALCSDPGVSRSCPSQSSFCHSDNMHNDSGYFSKNKIDSDTQPDMKNAEDSALFSNVSATEEVSTYPQTAKENTCVQKLETNSSPCAKRSIAIEMATGDSRNFKVSSPVIITSYSQETVKTVEEIFTDNNKTIKQNTKSKPDTCHTSCHEVLDNSQAFIRPSSLDDNYINSHKTFAYTQKEQILQHNNQSMSGLEKAQMQPVNLGTWDTCKSVRELPQAACPSRTYGIFSTASGKAVQVSDASLEKARQVFSEMDSGAKPSTVPLESNEQSDHSVRSKSSVVQNPKGVSSLPKTVTSNVSSSVFSGFSTAGGKRVTVSESALHKVKGMLEEFDLIKAEHTLQHSPTSEDLSKIPPQSCVEKRTPEYPVNSKLQKTCDGKFSLPNNYRESGSLGNTHVTEVFPQLPPLKEDTQLVLGTKVSLKKAYLLEKEQTLPQTIEAETGKMGASDVPVRTNVGDGCTSAKEPENYFETEAVEIAKAFMEDDELTDSEPSHVKHSLSTHPQNEALFNSKTRKRRVSVDAIGQPPIKRSLLNEFDRIIENKGKSLKPLKSAPDGTMKDRRLFTHHMSLEPVTCGPFCSGKERRETQRPHFTAPAQGRLSREHPGHSALEKPPSHPTASLLPTHKVSASRNERTRCSATGRSTTVFVPPFKMKSQFHSDEHWNSKSIRAEGKNHKSIDGDGEDVSDSDIRQCDKGSFHQEATECEEEPLDLMASLQNARDLQTIRIKKKERHHLSPQPGSLYLTKSSTLPRISLQAAVRGRVPSARSHKQLYMYGVSKECMNINSRNAEHFQFDIQNYFGKEDVCAGKGIQLADGGWLIPSNDGKAGKEEFYRALCDTPGVDPKLISSVWVSNHYRWIVWKLAAMEFAFPKEFANRCLNPERVLLQLKYRYDVEIDNSSRSALKKILERDDTAAKTLVLCVSDVLSPSTSGPEASGSETRADPKSVDTVELTDGWYAVKAQLDPPLVALVKSGRLTVGQKIITYGAELVGSPDACAPLEAPDSLRLKISANSTRPARWHSKLGFFRDPRPFPLFLSSLFSDGGSVGCVDIIVQRVYPLQWVEKTASGLYIFRNEKEEAKEAVRFAGDQQKKLEALFTKIQAEFKDREEDTAQPCVLSRALTRQQVHALQDGAELYAAVLSASDPGHLEGCFSEEQLRALNNHRQMLNDKKQAQIQSEFRKALESAEQEEGLSRDVTTVWKLRVTSYKKEEQSSLLSIWRPSADLHSLLTEGKRYRIYHLAVSRSRSKFERTSIQLTATKRTQYQQLPASQETLLQVYQPREPLHFSRLLEPAFQPPCSEVDLVGVVVSVVKAVGLAPLVYLSDECLNLLVVKFGTDVNEDIKPRVLVAASNLQWHPESRSVVPTLFAGNFSVFSTSPKEVYFQERANRMKQAIENIDTFYKEAEKKLLHLLNGDSPKRSTPTKDSTLLASTCPTAEPTPTGSQRFSPNSEQNYQSPLSHCTPKEKSTPLAQSAQPASKSCYGEREIDDPKTCRKRRALDFLSRLPLPPPVSPICTFVSPAAQKAFQPPRRCGTKHATAKKTKEPGSPQRTPCQKTSGVSLLEYDSVADEELALLSTPAFLPGSSEGNEQAFPGDSTRTPVPQGQKDPS